MRIESRRQRVRLRIRFLAAKLPQNSLGDLHNLLHRRLPDCPGTPPCHRLRHLVDRDGGEQVADGWPGWDPDETAADANHAATILDDPEEDLAHEWRQVQRGVIGPERDCRTPH